MKIIRALAILAIVLLVVAWLTVSSVTVNIPIGKVGVRTQEYGIFGHKGVVQEDFKPGWHRDLGPIDSWVLFDSTVQTLEMTKETSQGSRRGRDDVQVQSADGYAVSVDVTIKYRILAKMAHKLYQDTGSGTKYQTIVRTEAQQACIGMFGTMKTEDFYNPHERRKKATAVKALLTKSLADNFVEVLDVLIRDVQFDPEYEKKIRHKKLADQDVELNKSMTKAADMKGRTQKIEAETEKLVDIITKELAAALVRMEANTDRKVVKIKADYERYATEKKADADLVAAQKGAEGDLLTKKAEAEGERLRNEAMQGVGGSIIVALEAAKNLKFSKVTISTVQIDLLDVNAMVEKLGVPPAKKK
jgi:regulator of protease activity HflC (stomatin/prohibitin superfamily)